MQVVLYDFVNLFKLIFEITFVFKLKRKSTFELICFVLKFCTLKIHYVKNSENSPFRKDNLKFDIRPYQPLYSVAETESRKVETFVFSRKFRPLVYHWFLSYSFRVNYYFFNLEIQGSQYIIVRKLFKGVNYSRVETIWGNTVYIVKSFQV